MKPFKYNLIQLIEGVRDRPCLWNRKIDNYRDRLERRAAWVEIFNQLDDDYEDMTPEEKRAMEEQVQMKWVNIRDTFVKSLKTRPGRTRRKYVLYEHVKFLYETMQDQPEYEDPTSCDNDTDPMHEKRKERYMEMISDVKRKRSRKRESSEESNPKVSDEDSESKVSRRKRKSKQVYEAENDNGDEESVNFMPIDETISDPRIMNEDEAFFASLLPTVVRYNEDDRLEFRIEVLEVMRKIKDKKQWSGGTVIT